MCIIIVLYTPSSNFRQQCHCIIDAFKHSSNHPSVILFLFVLDFACVDYTDLVRLLNAPYFTQALSTQYIQYLPIRRRSKYHCTADLHVFWFGFTQAGKSTANFYVPKISTESKPFKLNVSCTVIVTLRYEVTEFSLIIFHFLLKHSMYPSLQGTLWYQGEAKTEKCGIGRFPELKMS